MDDEKLILVLEVLWEERGIRVEQKDLRGKEKI